jgi:uncharacterized protein (DUF427 family)
MTHPPRPRFPLITIAPNPNVVCISFAGHVIAQSIRALDLRENGRAAVVYIPRADCDMDLFSKTSHSSYCPHKGDASYYSVTCGGRTGDNVAWSYETPFGQVADIAGHLAFYADRVDAITQRPPEVGAGSLA